MSLAQALEDERREAENPQSASNGRRGLVDRVSAARNMFDLSSNGTAKSLPRERRYSAFPAGNLDVSLSPLGKKARKQSASVEVPKERRYSAFPAGGLEAPHSPSEKRTRKQSASADAMAAIFGGAPKDFQVSTKAQSSGRHNSIAGIGGLSRSPSQLHRSSLPGVGLLNNNRNSPMHIMTDTSDFCDVDNADEKPSEFGIKSNDSISDLALQPPAGKNKDGSAESVNIVRLEKDRPTLDGADEEAIESSEDEEEAAKSSDDGDGEIADRKRGRGRSRSGSVTNNSQMDSEESNDDDHPYASLYGENKSTRRAKSALAASEEDRVTQSKATMSSSEPSISIIGPGGERLGSKRGGVHPNTSYDYAASDQNSANSSDADISDIRRAQKLSINMSQIDSSVPNRVIRTILRGDFTTMLKEAEEGLRRQRLYLVATDLSDEAVYALEWTIGTILRDGDTLLAIYAVDEETGTGRSVEADAIGSVQIGEGGKAAQDAVDAMASQMMTMNQGTCTPSLLAPTSFLPAIAPNGRAGSVDSRMLAPSSYLPATATNSRAGSVDSRMLSKADLERQRAIEDISSTCVRLLRKTKLQVRVAVEVVHCKSPKHMITEAIDGLEPTLVILGSRGRSALKGVLLGSFSNYLVTKSSVPVMVARKKLRKHAKFRKTNIRLSNNLQRPNRLTSAKID